MDDNTQDPLLRPALNFVLAYGLLSTAGLLAAGLVFAVKIVVVLALLAAGVAYLSSFILSNAFMHPPGSEWRHVVANLVNPMLTALAIILWVAGVFQLWG